MSKPVILCVDDQREVLAALTKDLDPFAQLLDIIDAESGDDALGVLDDLAVAGTPVALVISDHVMPGISGVDLLARLRDRGDLPGLRKLLLTGLATQEDTIRAINEAAIDRYIAKPWHAKDLLATVGKLVSAFILERFPDGYQRFMPILDEDAMLAAMRRAGDR